MERPQRLNLRSASSVGEGRHPLIEARTRHFVHGNDDPVDTEGGESGDGLAG